MRRTFTGIFWFRSYELWCRDIPSAFPSDDDLTASANIRDRGPIDPMEEGDFSAFVFKIQANMNKAHRDRIAFMRICSGDLKPVWMYIICRVAKSTSFPATADDGK